MNTKDNLKSLYNIGAAAALLQLAVLLGMIVIIATLGPRPASPQEYFAAFQANRIAGLLRTDLTSLVMIGLYLLTFPALYAALRQVNPAWTALAALFTFAAVITCFATNSSFSMLYLSDQYAAAAGAVERSQLLAAGEAVIAADMWNSSGAYLAGILLQGAGMILSIVMLKSKDFSKVTAYAGLLGNGFDLAQHVLHPFAPGLSAILIQLAGPFYLVWFPMLGRDLFRLGRVHSKIEKELAVAGMTW
jgi:hypothetical protein